MQTLRSTFRREEAQSSTSNRNDSPLPVWVTHTPTPDAVSDRDDEDDDDSTSSPPPNAKNTEKESMRRRLKSLLPLSWSTLRRKQAAESNGGATQVQILPNGTRVSPPVSPLLERKAWGGSQEASSQNSHRPLLRESPADDFLHEESILTSIHPAEYYAEKLEVYKLKYSYLKSWPGLLRLLAGMELLFGGMVVACVIAYLHKDSEWSNSYGLYNGAYNNGQGLSGYSYSGPMTPFIIAVAGVSWIITMCLLAVGMTMYYRTILLDSAWWPLTEAFINLALFLLYMAAGIVYLNDLNRGGLCFMTIGVNPIMASLCRVEGGQMAGTAFIFINMTLYLGGFLVCLKMWKHEAARRERQYFSDKSQEGSHQPNPRRPPQPKRINFSDETDAPPNNERHDQKSFLPEVKRASDPTYNPSVHVIADYIIKYPEITCVEERETYKAVFNDQYQEYKDLHRDINTTLTKFRELDAMMEQLPRRGKSQEEKRRIENILKNYQQKKNDPTFVEKKQRCDYLKAKLSHIKNRIRTFDQETST